MTFCIQNPNDPSKTLEITTDSNSVTNNRYMLLRFGQSNIMLSNNNNNVDHAQSFSTFDDEDFDYNAFDFQ